MFLPSIFLPILGRIVPATTMAASGGPPATDAVFNRASRNPTVLLACLRESGSITVVPPVVWTGEHTAVIRLSRTPTDLKELTDAREAEHVQRKSTSRPRRFIWNVRRKNRKNSACPLRHNSSTCLAIGHPGRFVELLPLLIGPDDRVDVATEQTRIQRNGTALRICYDQSIASELRKTARTTGPCSVVVLRLQAEDRLDCSIRTP